VAGDKFHGLLEGVVRAGIQADAGLKGVHPEAPVEVVAQDGPAGGAPGFGLDEPLVGRQVRGGALVIPDGQALQQEPEVRGGGREQGIQLAEAEGQGPVLDDVPHDPQGILLPGLIQGPGLAGPDPVHRVPLQGHGQLIPAPAPREPQQACVGRQPEEVRRGRERGRMGDGGSRKDLHAVREEDFHAGPRLLPLVIQG